MAEPYVLSGDSADGSATETLDNLELFRRSVNGSGVLRLQAERLINMGPDARIHNVLRDFARRSVNNREALPISYLFLVSYFAGNSQAVFGLLDGMQADYQNVFRALAIKCSDGIDQAMIQQFGQVIDGFTLDPVLDITPSEGRSDNVLYSQTVTGVIEETRDQYLKHMMMNWNGARMEDSIVFNSFISQGAFAGLEMIGIAMAVHFRNVIGLVGFLRALDPSKYPILELKLPALRELLLSLRGDSCNVVVERTWIDLHFK